MKNYLFAKFFQNYSVDELMNVCKGLGVDGPTLMIRDGYWVTAENLKSALPGFVTAASNAGLEVTYADSPYNMEDLPNLSDELSLMRDCGIKQFRVNHIFKKTMPARELHDMLVHRMAIAAECAQKHDIQAVVQLHGVMYPHNATAAYAAIKGLDPKYIGVKIDPGNNLCQEGYELFDYQIELLDEYIAAIGEKDVTIVRLEQKQDGDKGWRRGFVPGFEGLINYEFIFSEMAKRGINVPGILMPFYNDNDTEKLIENLRKEIAYFKDCQQKAGL